MTADTRLPELGTAVQKPVTTWAQLAAEMRMLCCGLTISEGWTLRTVSTFVRLPGDQEYQQAIGTLCRRLAGEYGLEQSVVREGPDWRVRFSRPTADQAATARHAAPHPIRQLHGAMTGIARATAALRGYLLSARH